MWFLPCHVFGKVLHRNILCLGALLVIDNFSGTASAVLQVLNMSYFISSAQVFLLLEAQQYIAGCKIR